LLRRSLPHPSPPLGKGRGQEQLHIIGAEVSLKGIWANTSQRVTKWIELGERRFYAIVRTKHFMTPTLANFMYSLLAGGLIVVVPATVGLIFISQKDKIQRS
jgi:photosystem II PsbX protein